MASEQEQICITLPAASTLSSFQYRAVKIDTSGYAALATGTADVVIGILQNKPLGSCEAKIAIVGHTKAIAAATISPGDFLSVHSAGAVREGAYGPSRILGVATTVASGTGEYVELILEKWLHY